MRVTEVAGGERWKPLDLLLPTALQATPFTLLERDSPAIPRSAAAGGAALTALDLSGPGGVLVLLHRPLRLELYIDGVLTIAVNERDLLHYDKTQSKTAAASVEDEEEEEEDRHGGREIVDYGEDGLAIYSDGSKEVKKESSRSASTQQQQQQGWAESFREHHDSRPDGPRSVGVDLSFPFAQHVYGIPQHTAPLALPTTAPGSAGRPPRYSQPYRMYTLDVFEYELDEPMALYGNIPLLLAHGLVAGRGISAGAFWFNPSETFIDLSDGGAPAAPYKQSHWVSESGDVDLFLLTGPSPHALSRQFTRLVGTQQLPPIFALGYHQCRWNYRDEQDVAEVDAAFERLDYPYDVLWLDIEHTRGKRYFTWDAALFPTPRRMIEGLSAHGRKMVTIVDPHIKRDEGYSVHAEATRRGLYIKDKTGADFDGWCWPGSSSYLDFTR